MKSYTVMVDHASFSGEYSGLTLDEGKSDTVLSNPLNFDKIKLHWAERDYGQRSSSQTTAMKEDIQGKKMNVLMHAWNDWLTVYGLKRINR